MRIKNSFFFYSIIILLSSCAIQVPPDGGAKDTEPPHVISSYPPNHSTSFNGHYISLNFDEYISLNEINSQLIVSPLLKYSVETKIKKKTLLIHLKDTLLPNSTYTFNFGQGIIDYTEGNKLNDYQFVFSTGPVIDSLAIGGKIENAYDHKTSKGVLVMLYKEDSDSLPYLERPLYFALTNDSGEFHIKNISPGSYKFIALKEKDGDYKYLSGEDLIGFTNSRIEAGTENIHVRIFNELPTLRFLRAYSEFPGKAVIVFSAPADTLKWKWLSDSTKLNLYSINYSDQKDSVFIWYKNVLADSLSLCFDYKKLNDTITLRLFKKTESPSGRGKIGLTIGASSQNLIQHLHLPLYLQSNHPIAENDFSKIIFLEDSIKQTPQYIFVDSLHTQIDVEHKWKGKSNYTVFIPPGTFTDIYGVKNDTVKLAFSTHGETDYGSVKLFFKKTDYVPYVVQLIDDGGIIVYREFSCVNDTTVELSNLDPKVYRLKLIRDVNGNGIWDSGDYLNHIQPEVIEFYHEGITVRANWDVDLYIKAPLTKDK